MDLQELIDRLLASGDIGAVADNVNAQFGPPTRRYVGATLLPERTVEELAYEEKEIRFRTVIANDGTRYSPAQKKSGGEIIASMFVVLGNQDIAREFTGRDYDGLIRLLGRGRSMEAMLQVIRFVDVAVNLALIELNEKQRWDAIIDARVVRRGDNGYVEPVYYPNPPGSRTYVAGQWSNPLYDPWPDIMGPVQSLANLGYAVNRIITSRKVVSILSANPKIAQRAGMQPLVLNSQGNLVQMSNNLVSRDGLNNLASRDGIPAFETYDLSYNTQTATTRFMRDDAMVFACTTGRDAEIVNQQELILVPNTLGYFAIGPAVGQVDSGRVINLEAYTSKPPRIEVEGWQSGLPVIQDPQAMMVLKGIS